ncbi:unnamed protein product [Rotaria sp. Silwood2]|nr:unnamed protein product [Rotaria sp. Silwood2]CAF4283166.1 unnamed protein product [Rotaria sp. Silwood2]
MREKVITNVYHKLSLIAAAKENRHLVETHIKTIIDMIVSVSPHLDSLEISILSALYDLFLPNINLRISMLLSEFFQPECSEALTVEIHDRLDMTHGYVCFSKLLQMQQKHDEALKYSHKCLKIQLNLVPENHPQLSETYEIIGDQYVLTNNQHIKDD